LRENLGGILLERGKKSWKFYSSISLDMWFPMDNDNMWPPAGTLGNQRDIWVWSVNSVNSKKSQNAQKLLVHDLFDTSRNCKNPGRSPTYHLPGWMITTCNFQFFEGKM
jgi:hypothetical protein